MMQPCTIVLKKNTGWEAACFVHIKVCNISVSHGEGAPWCPWVNDLQQTNKVAKKHANESGQTAETLRGK